MIIAPYTWLSAVMQVDDQPAVLHADELVDADDAGLGIDRDVGHLHAADACAGQAVVRRPFPLNFQRHRPDQRAACFQVQTSLSFEKIF